MTMLFLILSLVWPWYKKGYTAPQKCMPFTLYADAFFFAYWLFDNTTVKSPTEDPLFHLLLVFHNDKVLLHPAWTWLCKPCGTIRARPAPSWH